ncbi:hypothetical protein VTN77DRAFT_5185 [Rasamsonia byssochlamydoides]|uniref:uncharacterized protein n=1 Tax=Rasamsonia byssochlamydoides TaxID=89139 RepID=UPI0037443882
MASVVVNRVMGQGEQQTLLPFFGQYPRRTNRNVSQASSSCRPSSDQDETTANNASRKSIEPPPVQSGSQDTSAVQAPFNCQHAPAQSPETPQDASLEEDPNSSRRKRLRTSAPWESDNGSDDQARPVHATPSCDVSQDRNVETFRHDREVQSPRRDISSGIDDTFDGSGDGEGHVSQKTPAESTGGTVNSANALPEPAVAALPSPESQGSAQNSSAPNSLGSTEAADSHPPSTEKKSPPRKILKLNPNGKLLSSPPSARFEDKTQNKPQNKRKTAAKRSKDTRVVIIKYGGGAVSKEDLGKMVDDIIHGRRRHTPPRRQDVPSTTSGPPKPTHPFFLKNAGRKPEKSAPVTNTSSIPATASSKKANEANEKSTSSSDRREIVSQTGNAVQFPRSRFPKYPDPVAPLWPPRDMVHVRGVEVRPFRDAPGSILPGPRKDKGSVVGVSDSENVLLAELRNADSETLNPPATTDAEVLRIPKRHVASGSVLQNGINSQLSHHTVGEPGSTPRTARSGIPAKQSRRHPAVVKLHSSIPSTMSAFDTGVFDSIQWTQKYAPTCAEEVLQVGPEAVMLRDWLKNLMVSAVDTGRPSKDKQNKKRSESSKRAKRRKASDKLDGFIVSSGDEASEMDELSDPDEDELAGDVTVPLRRTVVRVGDLGTRSKGGDDKGRMANAVLISGPSGCGKTASVYAVAKELDFEVFEINSGTRRSAKDILERVGDMTQNHLVHNLDNSKAGTGDDSNQDVQPQDLGPTDAKQTTMNSFFKSAPRDTSNQHTQKRDKKKDKQLEKTVSSTPSRHQKQSLILLEEADILFEEDKQFWTGVLTLISQSKRPIIITCNNEDLIPLQDLSLHAILRYRPPTHDLAVDYLLLVAASEGHMLEREAISDLYTASNQDLRKSLMELNFWCQMAVGSEKSGLDWMIDRWPQGSDLDVHGDRLRVISLNTYQRFMGWFNRDMLMSKNDLARETELLLECLNWWQLDFQDMPNVEGSKFLASDNCRISPGKQDAKSSSFDLVQKVSGLADSQSVLDVLSRGWSLKQEEDELDTSVTDLPEKQRSNYVEGYPLLYADCKPDYTGLSASIGSTAGVLISHLIWGDRQADSERLAAERVLEKAAKSKIPGFSGRDFLTAFEPIMRADYVFPPPTGRTAPSFENGTAVIAEDLAPYIRAIMAFDLRLERYRLELSGLMSQGSSGKRKARTTKASRAALEGGDKANTRRERWFPRDANPSRILATGSKEWQDVLVQCRYFDVPSIRQERRGSSHSVSESSGDGGF